MRRRFTDARLACFVELLLAGYRRNEALSLAYLQLAADRGSALAQFGLGMHYDNRLKHLPKAEALYACAAAQGSVSAAIENGRLSKKFITIRRRHWKITSWR